MSKRRRKRAPLLRWLLSFVALAFVAVVLFVALLLWRRAQAPLPAAVRPIVVPTLLPFATPAVATPPRSPAEDFTRTEKESLEELLRRKAGGVQR